jgi:hypothetical protein
VLGGMDPWVGIALLEPVPHMDIFLAAFDEIPDPRADNARHDLCELLIVGSVAVLCGATSCAEMADFDRVKEHVFRDFLKLRHSIPSHDTFSTVFRMIDPKALDAAFGRVLAQIAVLLGDGDVIAIDGKALRRARDRWPRFRRAGRGDQRRAMPMHRGPRHLQGCANGSRQTAARRQSQNGGHHDLPLLPDAWSISSRSAATFFWMAMIASLGGQCRGAPMRNCRCMLCSWPSGGANPKPGSMCSIPDDHTDPRRSAFFMARSIMRDIRSGVQTC